MKIVFNNVFFRCRNRLRRKGFEHLVWRAASKVRSGNAGEVYFFCVQTHTTNTSCRFPLLLEGRAGGNCLDIQLAQLPSGSGCLNQLSLGSGAAKIHHHAVARTGTTSLPYAVFPISSAIDLTRPGFPMKTTPGLDGGPP